MMQRVSKKFAKSINRASNSAEAADAAKRYFSTKAGKYGFDSRQMQDKFDLMIGRVSPTRHQGVYDGLLMARRDAANASKWGLSNGSSRAEANDFFGTGVIGATDPDALSDLPAPSATIWEGIFAFIKFFVE